MPSELITSPRCRADQLGLPMPDDRHAVSVCLPLWEHNVGYEEGDPLVHSQLKAAYPRFCFHPLVKAVCAQYLDGPQKQGLPFVSRAAARRAMDYVRHAAGVTAELVDFPDQMVCGVTVPQNHFSILKQYWQHAGENVSSRVAELILENEAALVTETGDRASVRVRVAELCGVSSPHVFLFPSGMSAIAAAWRTVVQVRSGFTCQFGFPYVDTLKIQQRFPGASHVFFPVGGTDDLRALKDQCLISPPAAVFCELPTNPLLITPDLSELRSLADTYDFLLIVDDTLGACGNLNVVPYADVVVTSLTKYFSGYGNVLAGSLVVNPDGRCGQQLLESVRAGFEETLSDADVSVLNQNSVDFRDRVAVINQNAAQLASFLRQHPTVDSVYYPSEDDPGYEAVRVSDGGYGGLLSIVLKDPATRTPGVFDRLEVCKGPNLGTNFTLCCPYTILAHYDELDAVESCGVSRWLLRISVGTEAAADLMARFQRALEDS